MKGKNLAIGCGMSSVLVLLVIFVAMGALFKACQSCSPPDGAGRMALDAAYDDPRVALEVGGIVAATPMPGFNSQYLDGQWHVTENVSIDGVTMDAIYSATVSEGPGGALFISAAQLTFDDGSVVIFDPPAVMP